MKKRIYSNVLSLSILTIVLIVITFVYTLNQSLSTQIKKEIQSESEFIAAACDLVGDTESFLRKIGNDMELRITWISRDGTILYDNQAAADKMENHLSRPEIQEAIKKGTGTAIRDSKSLLLETYYYAAQLADGSFLRLACENKSVIQTFSKVFPLLLMIAAMILFFAVLIAHRLSKSIVTVINEIDLKKPMENVPFHELLPLLGRLEHQNKRVKEQMANLLEQERKFNTITQNMNEGLILLDMDLRIIFMNNSCRRLFDTPGIDYTGKRIYQFNRSEAMQDTVKAALQGKSSSSELKMNEKQVQFFGNPVIEEERITGVVLFVLDITEKQIGERHRKEFSANVSHELKTPLTSILGYAELMKNQMVRPDDIPVFSGKIYEEAARLLTLVNDIIKISRLDEKDIHQSKELVDLYGMAKETVQELRQVAEKQNVQISLEGNKVIIIAVPQMIRDLIYNLCENAIKYNVENGKVNVRVYEEDGHPVLCVSDTGIGIPMKYQERIFERFYRIDKSHSKQTGGTGLGLSIVKHVVEYQGGYIELHSDEKGGTTITVHL